MRNMSKCVTALNLQGKNMFHNTYTINKSICFHSFDLIIFFYTVVCPNSALKPTSIAKSGKNMRFIHHRQKNGIITACYLVFSDTSHLMQTNEITRFACITWKCSSQRKAKKRNDVEVGARCVLLIKCIASKEEKTYTKHIANSFGTRIFWNHNREKTAAFAIDNVVHMQHFDVKYSFSYGV